MINLPNLSSRVVNSVNGLLIEPWVTYFRQINVAPSPIIDIDVSASPFSYVAKEPGFIHIAGGIISAIAIIRGSVTITITGTNLIPVQIGDTVRTTYTGLPTIKFVPTYTSGRNQ